MKGGALRGVRERARVTPGTAPCTRGWASAARAGHGSAASAALGSPPSARESRASLARGFVHPGGPHPGPRSRPASPLPRDHHEAWGQAANLEGITEPQGRRRRPEGSVFASAEHLPKMARVHPAFENDGHRIPRRQSPEGPAATAVNTEKYPNLEKLVKRWLRQQDITHYRGKRLNVFRGPGEAQSDKRPTSARVMISRFVGSSRALGSVLTAQSLEPASDSVSPSLSAPPLLALALSLSLSQN